LEIPERLLDDPDELIAWVRRAHEIALAAKTRQKLKRG
jgi:TfoX/Sxy family transcriptional regulator of competence genes